MDYKKQQKKNYKNLNKRLTAYIALLNSIYENYNKEASKIALKTGYSAEDGLEFKWSDYPETKYAVERLQQNFSNSLTALIYSGISKEWRNSNEVQDLLANEILKKYKAQVDGEKYKIIYQTNPDALKAFRERTDKGMSISDKIWKQSDQYMQSLEAAISTAISKGTSAVTLSKQISKYLIDFNKLKKDYKTQFGQATDILDCEYRSARLARSEINMAYRTAEQTRWGQMDFICGYRVELSNNHSDRRKKHGEYTDICDELQGEYPKDFKWTGWHPNCYKKGTMVLTDDGWKDFADVDMSDRILSLNPDTRETEWVGITDKQVFRHSGKMVRFFNNNLECVVTPEHSMVYLNKTNGEIRRLPAIEYRKGNGAFYRSCLYNGTDIQNIDINGKVLDFDLFCEFMGYYLSEGSLMRNSGVALCQMEGEKARDKMMQCLVKIGFKPCLSHEKVSFYDSRINRYLKQFGTSSNKYIPDEILNASKRQIRIFLDAFVICDGHERKCKTFIGNRGNVFIPKNTEKQYFTTSQRMAGNICELLLKSGHRPSFAIRQPVSTTRKNGKTISGNYQVFIIRECISSTATVFDKELVDYDDNVYDLTLERNHIMYIAVNGKCFWGSNCRCHAVPIMMSEEDFIKWNNGESVDKDYIKDVPDNFKRWAAENADKISASRAKGTLPYFVKDNMGYVQTSEQLQQYALLQKQGTNILKVAKDYGEIDYKQLEDIVGKITGKQFYSNADMSTLKAEIQSAISQIQKQRAAENALSDIIPDVHQWHKQVTLAELEQVHKAVSAKLSQLATLPLEKQAAKLDFEANEFLAKNMNNVQSKFPKTWKIAQSAYLKKLDEVNSTIALDKVKNQLDAVAKWSAQHPKSIKVANLLSEANKAISNGESISVIEQKANLATAEYQKRLAEQARREAKKAVQSVQFSEDAFTQARKDNAVWDKGTGQKADNVLFDTASKTWLKASEGERNYIYEYTRHYCDVNEPLQGRKYSNPQSRDRFEEKVNSITSYIDKSELKTDMWFTRGDTSLSAIASRIKFAGGTMPPKLQDLVGMVMEEGGFMSTGSRKGKGFNSRPIILNIYAPKGTKAAYVEPFSAFGNGAKRNWDGVKRFSSFSDEQETLFQRGTQMRITKVYQERGKTYIDCEVIGQNIRPLTYVKDENIGY